LCRSALQLPGPDADRRGHGRCALRRLDHRRRRWIAPAQRQRARWRPLPGAAGGRGGDEARRGLSFAAGVIMGPGSEDGVAGCSNRPRRKRMLACCCMAVAIVLCASGCTTLSMHGGRLPDGLQIDGLGLDDRAASTTREVISMLDLDPSCASPASPCAERILVAPGTIREGTRLVAAADVLYRAARRDRRSQRASQLQACVHATRRYLHAPSLPGRENAISARSQLALRLHNACTAELALDAISATGVEGFDWDVDIGSFPQQSVRSIALAAQVRMRGLRTRQVEDGLGVAAIAYGRTTEPVGSF